MVKKIVLLVIVLAAIGLLVWWFVYRDKPVETPAAPVPAAPASIKIVRETKIHDEWIMQQLEINLETEISLDLNLTAGDKVEGLYYLEKGDDIDFTVIGNSLIYQSQPADVEKDSISSDKFTFTASPEQGKAYTLTFIPSDSSVGENRGATIFLELVYPTDGDLYVPLGTE